MKMVEMLALATVVSDGVTRKCKILDFAVLTVPRVGCLMPNLAPVR